MKQFTKGLLALGLMASTSIFAQAPAKEAVCKACHGEGGGKPIMEIYPKLNGQNKAYLVSILKSYRSGERKGGQSAVMTAQAKMLSDDDIEALATYYSSQK